MPSIVTGHIVRLLVLAMVVSASAVIADDNAAEAEVDAVLTKLVSDYESRDVQAIMSHYINNDRLVVFDVTPPLQFVGHEAYATSYQDFYAAFPGAVTVEIMERKISVAGDFAYAHEMNTWTVHDEKDRPTAFTARETYILQKAQGRWQIVHEHASVPVDVTTGNAALRLEP